MQKLVISFLIILMLFLRSIKVAYSSATLVELPPPSATHDVVADTRVVTLSEFLVYHHSPLVPYANHFVEAATKYDLPDWRLLPAITGVESSFGKRIPENSYNAYGWANGAYKFSSWEESIDVVTAAIKNKYIDRGADTVEKMAPIYAPPSQTWAGKVNYIIEKIADFELSTTISTELLLTL